MVDSGEEVGDGGDDIAGEDFLSVQTRKMVKRMSKEPGWRGCREGRQGVYTPYQIV